MNLTLCTALCLQVLAVALMRHRLGRSWLRRPVTIFVFTAVIYNGITELLLTIPSVRVWDMNRIGIEQSYIDLGALYVSAGLLALVISYVATKPERGSAPIHCFDTAAAMRMLDWRILIVACAPLAVFTYQGRGYNGSAGPGATSISRSNSSFCW